MITINNDPGFIKNVNELIAALSWFHPVSDEIAEFFRHHLFPIKLPKKKLLLKAGMVCGHLYFIKKGAIRGFLKHGAKEITTWITVDGEIVTSIGGLNGQQASKEYIQSVEASELLAMKFEDLEKLYDTFPAFNIIGRKLLQKYYHDAENRALLVRIPKAEHRYLHFIDTQSHLANRIPLTYIASYLGLRLETLSKVRSKIARHAR
ncbi:Crp/Fnr family transcriptional regulator [Terrimonas sp. NA20]|uniref:Crp/Fnr family transcriptional regulator n=1 Tax=Terrimonas ginsenosidimutans TaxID=2908004 RepID=A0ABS9KVB4_9BACT|nr:Crp/Fnr family transcriptional regulator [Terrimonas ginsenosidimutans]MCG2616263.1 Crp/Fnr family transcriptional regulator [Terrimonas ginsenosidimutans]